MTDRPNRAAGYAVHAFTASGVVFVFLAVAEICSPAPDPRLVFLWLGIQVLIDALDGPMARAVKIKEAVPEIDGRTIDDLVDYLSYTFVPLLLIWRLDLLPGPDALWVVPAMVASLFGFANTGAKDESAGFFLGFPSYWNIVAAYVVAWHGGWPSALLIAALTVLTVMPVRFLYPNLAPRPWKTPVMVGAAIWTLALIAIIATLPTPPTWLVWASLIYPILYAALSLWLDRDRVTTHQ
ncbi:phosphatidylcholine synthase [bacterium]|nr:MAG: phosphatidylcholine synthase [bacterium]